MKQSSITTSNSASGFGLQPTHEQISHRAEELWKKHGSPADRDEEIWLAAERQLQRGEAGAATSSGTAARSGTRRSSSRNGGSVSPREA